MPHYSSPYYTATDAYAYDEPVHGYSYGHPRPQQQFVPPPHAHIRAPHPVPHHESRGYEPRGLNYESSPFARESYHAPVYNPSSLSYRQYARHGSHGALYEPQDPSYMPIGQAYQRQQSHDEPDRRLYVPRGPSFTQPEVDLDAEERALAERLAAIRAEKARAQREAQLEATTAQREADVKSAQAAQAAQAASDAKKQACAKHVADLRAQLAAIERAELAARDKAQREEQELRNALQARERNEREVNRLREVRRSHAQAPPQCRPRWEQRLPQAINGAEDICAALASLGLIPRAQAQTQAQPEAPSRSQQERSTAGNIQSLLSRFGAQPAERRQVPEEVNDVLGKLFGFTIGSGEDKKAAAPAPAKAASPARKLASAPSPPCPATPTRACGGVTGCHAFTPTPPRATSPRAATPERAPTPETSTQVVPNEVNDLLSALFGFRVEKASDEEIKAASSNIVPPAAPSSSSASPTPAGNTDNAERPFLPREVNDVLSNLFGFSIEPLNGSAGPSQSVPDDQYALENDIKSTAAAAAKALSTASTPVGKGKAVAEGERKAAVKFTSASAPATSPASAHAPTSAPAAEPPIGDALWKLERLSTELARLRSTFTMPTHLSFGPSSDDSSSAPPLLYNSTNAPYHLQAHQLLQLLVKADAIDSNGDKAVRRVRKDVVRRIEQEIEDLEAQREKIWAEQGADAGSKKDPRAARVEDSDDESESEVSSVKEVDNKTYAEVVQEVKGSQHDTAEAATSTEKEANEEKGYEVPAAQMAETATTEQASATPTADATSDITSDQPEAETATPEHPIESQPESSEQSETKSEPKAELKSDDKAEVEEEAKKSPEPAYEML